MPKYLGRVMAGLQSHSDERLASKISRISRIAVSLFRFRITSLLREAGEIRADIQDFLNNRNRRDYAVLVAYRSGINGGLFTHAGFSHFASQLAGDPDLLLVGSRVGYMLYGRRARAAFSLEPFSFAPPVKYLRSQRVGMYFGDPWNKLWMVPYLKRNRSAILFTQYVRHARYLLDSVGLDHAVVDLLWCIPDHEYAKGIARSISSPTDLSSLNVFGSAKHRAYSLRNELRGFPGVRDIDLSGNEGRALPFPEYFDFLRTLDSGISAMDNEGKFDVVFPKSVEIAGAGALLFQQYSADLSRYGFEADSNCIVFRSLEDFAVARRRCLDSTLDLTSVRRDGLRLIGERHLTSHRVSQIKAFLG